MSIKEKMAQALAKRDVMEMPWETLTPAAQWVYLCDVDAMLAALSTAEYAIVLREPTKAMVEQGTHQIGLGGNFPDRAIRVYQSMVAASEDETKPGQAQAS